MNRVAVLAVLLVCLPFILAQDPADGWLGYAMATSDSGGIITYIEGKWVVPDDPQEGGAFFSPWFGIEASDNLNLIQPVNPWVGDSWEIYNEYFQWEPEYNYNSDSNTVQAGDVLFGSVKYDAKSQSYIVYHSDMTSGWSVTSTIQIQQDDNGNYKNYTIAYFVMEKEWDCSQYPPNNQVTFYDIEIQYDGKTVTPDWTTGYVDDVCDCRAHILNATSVQITWTSSGKRH